MKKAVLLLLFIMAIPKYVFADGLIPIIPLFYSFDDVMISFITIFEMIIVIIVEAILLKRVFRKIRFINHFLISIIINLVSYFIGTILVFVCTYLLNIKWDNLLTIILIVLLGIILTIFSEYPIVKLSYKNELTWRKALFLTIKINFIGYLVLLFMLLLIPYLWFIGIPLLLIILFRKKIFRKHFQHKSSNYYNITQ